MFDPLKPPTIQYDQYVPLMALPCWMQTTIETIPARIPYVQADVAKVAAWRKRLCTKGLRVGIAWTGSDADPRRACRLADWRPWWSMEGLQFYSLQKGAGAREAEELPLTQHLIHIEEEHFDLDDTAAMIANLDLVISVDTAIAHLAGAMGKPVWVLLPFASDWRWLSNRKDSPWYPTARLFRQTKPNDWSTVIEQVRVSLARLEKKPCAGSCADHYIAENQAHNNLSAPLKREHI